jgi:hypothetical protein
VSNGRFETIKDTVLTAQCEVLEEQFRAITQRYLDGDGIPIEQRLHVLFNVLCSQAAKLAHVVGKSAEQARRDFGDGVKVYKERVEEAIVSRQQNG